MGDAVQSDETDIVREMIKGDKDAFDRLMKLYQSKALRVAYLISGSYADSEDIVQETFVACYLNRQKIKSPEAFQSWFYRTLSRNAWRVCRKQKREQPMEEVYPEETAAPGELLESLVMKEDGTELLFSSLVNKVVADSYVITDEEKELQESGKLNIAYDGRKDSKVDIHTSSHVTWTQDDIVYSMMAIESGLTAEELLNMAQEIAESES